MKKQDQDLSSKTELTVKAKEIKELMEEIKAKVSELEKRMADFLPNEPPVLG